MATARPFTPIDALQYGSVWRLDAPSRGRPVVDARNFDGTFNYCFRCNVVDSADWVWSLLVWGNDW